jgi:hypothetical protein
MYTVSDSIWMPNVAGDFSTEDIDQQFFTLIPSRWPLVDVYARVANGRSHELAEIESLTNPRLRERDRILNGVQQVDGNGPLLQNWNHAPFTYYNPEGTRFFDANSPALELAADIQTALAISVKRRETFLRKTDEAPIGLEMRELSRRVKGRFVDGRDWDPELDQAERRHRGRQIVEAGYDGVLFRASERPSGTCISVLRGEVLDRAVQRDHFKFVWDGTKVNKVYSFRLGTAYSPDDLSGAEQLFAA